MMSTASLVAALLLQPTITEPPPEPLPIVGGDVVEGDEFEAVVALVFGVDFCSGTLVRDDLILTAAHCLRHVQSPAEIRVLNGPSLSAPSVPATDFGMHPDFDADAERDAFDYGFVSIAPGALDATPIDVVIDQDEWDALAPTLREDETVFLVGYGLDPGASGPDRGIKKRVSTRVRGFTGSGIEFIAGGDGRDSCRGDSGGPALARNARGELRLIGITARGSDPCGEFGYYGVPYYALAWLSEAVARPLCGESCGDCSCLDTAPEADAGCGCTTQTRGDPDGPGPAWLLVLALGLTARRRSTR